MKFPIVSRCLLLLLLLTDVVAHVAGLTPNTTYRVSIRAKNIKASPYVDEKSLIRLLEKLSAHTEFRTLKKGKNISKHIHKISFLTLSPRSAGSPDGCPRGPRAPGRHGAGHLDTRHGTVTLLRGLELSTNLREVSQCLEKAPTTEPSPFESAYYCFHC